MDRLSYIYPKDNNGQLTSNRLRHVLDGVSGSNYANKDLVNQAADNYHYDNIGNLTADPANGVSQIQWTVYGKISRITKTNGDALKYTYDATGNRIYKEYISGGVTNRTWYARDAQGNTLAVYGNKNGDSQVYWNEQDLYGSSRLGTWQPGITLTAGAGVTAWSQEGLSRYELTNHLGNVLSTISDQRVGVDNDHNGTIDYYLPTIASYSDYTPFGMQMVDRNGSAGGYRYGFNGKEDDKEIEGQQDYGFRIYDKRLGRFKSIDPLAKKYPELTPYQFASNSPIMAIDLDGLEAYAVYNKATSQLALIPDISKVNPKLTNKFVSALEYSKLTDADKAKANYGILVKNVFTGGHSDGSQIVHGDPSRPKEKPISTGTYNILENKGNTNPDHNSFFVLDPQDKNPYDKVDDRPGEINSDGEKRSGYNLHPGRVSWGCVTLCKDDPNMTPEQRAEEWNIINGAINNTTIEQVPDNRGKQKYIPFTTQTKFGTLKVTDESPSSTTPKKTGN
ncbi:RHS repeat-associated core domain-containing protein [Chitinophaga costaii]|uniref:RHS repeat-associated core domain-containing protein n=1 Tax=Chitinophaga costaii TaxID=1335309 RepID=A0A1C4G962_9BACT|nr:RHS repeat-associated core domain-containing protein [Chitinophaga costaii]